LTPPAVKAGVTVAVKITCWLTAEGFGEDVTDVVAVVVLTTWLTVLEVAPLKLVSPLYFAVMECVPCEVNATVQEGTTPAVKVEVPVAG
jgi:hypothetical protein